MNKIVLFLMGTFLLCQSVAANVYKNVIFDLGGVILEGGVQSFVKAMREERPHVDASFVDVTKNPFWEMWDKGFINSAELINELSHTYNREDLTQLFSMFMSPTRPFSQECLGLIEELVESGYKVYLLSNFSKEMYELFIVSNPKVFESFSGMLFSFQVGIVKPDTAIYTHLLELYDIEAEESLFIDDSMKNIEAAEHMGITGILYVPGTLREELYHSLISP